MNLFINHKVEETNKEIVITLFVNTRFGYEEFGEEFLARGKNWLLKNEARKYVTSHLPNIRGGIVKVAFGSIIIASIPLSASAEEVNSEQVEMIVYTVQYEDNLYRIAQKFNVEIEQIKEINGIDNDTIYVGQELKIPNTTETIKSESEMHQNLETEMEIPDTDVSEPNETDVQHDKESFTYIVKAGDTLTSISNRYNVNIEQIRLMNGLTSDVIYIGQELKVFGQETKEEPVSLVLSTGITHPDVKKLKLDLEKLGYVVSNNPTNYYGPVTAETVREFQKAYGLNATGIADSSTLQKITEVLSADPVLSTGITHPDVKELKINLAKIGFVVSNNPTNYYGPVTAEQVGEFQRKYGLNVTGIADKNTLEALENILNGNPITEEQNQVILLREGVVHKNVLQLKEDLAKVGFKVSDNPNDYFGPITADTVREFQRSYNLPIDGIAGTETLQKLDELVNQAIPTPFNRVLKQGDVGEDVRLLQTYLNDVGFKVVDQPTANYASLTEKKVREFQQYHGLTPNGVADARTLQKLVTERAGIAESIGSFLITGKAYGHSVGMTQWGAYGMAQAGHTYDQILKYYYTGVGIGKRDTTNLNVRVLLEQNVDLLTISSNQPYQVGDKEFLPQTKTTIKYQNGEYLFENSGKSYKLTSSFQISSTNGGLLYFDNKQYEGIFTISTSNGKLDLINHLNVENYLKGVVPYEIIPSWNNLELYKAQTLAARTYVLKQIQANSNKKFDVYDTTQSQVYEGVPQTIPSQYVTKINQAIAETKGEVILYNGALIDAVYSASAGGHTVDAVDVWGNHIPYLVGKEDPYDQSRYSQNWWSYSITKSDLEKMFPELGTIISVTITETKYDRPTKIKVTGKSKEITLTGAEFRQKLGYNNLSSAVFTIEGIH